MHAHPSMARAYRGTCFLANSNCPQSGYWNSCNRREPEPPAFLQLGEVVDDFGFASGFMSLRRSGKPKVIDRGSRAPPASMCLFVLVPQVEDAFRNVARRLGESVTKEKRGLRGWEVSMNLGDLLSMDKVKAEVGEDIHFWIRAILADARGMNLRNLVAHGLVGRAAASYYNCEMVIHCLLMLGAYKEVAISCARRADAMKEKREAAELAAGEPEQKV